MPAMSLSDSMPTTARTLPPSRGSLAAPGQIAGGVRVVRHVEDQRRLPPHDLETPRQCRLLQPGEDRAFVDFQWGAVQRRQRGSGIGQRYVRRRQIGQQRVAALPLPAISCSLKLRASPRRYSGAPSVSAT